jgi:hypothetical protein
MEVTALRRQREPEGQGTEMKREQLLRLLRAEAKRLDREFRLDRAAGKGSHYQVRIRDFLSTVQSGDLTSLQVR